MLRVLDQTDAFSAKLGVALRLFQKSPRICHVGLLYRASSGELRLSHLRWDFDFKDETYKGGYYCGESNLDRYNQDFLAAWLEAFPQAENAIPYGINPEGVAFDPKSGELLPYSLGKGLTCATFVVAVYHSQGFPFFDLASWRSTASDVEWQQFILSRLNISDPERRAAIERDLGTFRVRPEHAAGGVLKVPPQLNYTQAEELAAIIVAQIG